MPTDESLQIGTSQHKNLVCSKVMGENISVKDCVHSTYSFFLFFFFIFIFLGQQKKFNNTSNSGYGQ